MTQINKYILKNVLAIPFGFYVLLFISFNIYSLYTLKKYVTLKHKSELLIFSDSVREELALGIYSSVFLKCQAFIESSDVKSVSVVIQQSNEEICYPYEEFDYQNILYFDKDQTEALATIRISFDGKLFASNINNNILILLSLLLAFAFFLFWFSRRLQEDLVIPVNVLLEHLNRRRGPLGVFDSIYKQKIFEFNEIQNGILNYQNSIESFQSKLIKLRENEKAAEIARQVAHDIRSPLAALDMMLGSSLAELPEGKRVVVRGAVERIRDIANNLVQRATISSGGSLDTVSAMDASHIQVSLPTMATSRVELLAVLLDSLISEKRMQFRSELGVSIEARLGPESYGLFSSVSAVDFKRVLSNLINNAVEALPMSDGRRSGQVWIELQQRERTIELSVNDNGKGIAAEVLPKLGVVGVSFGKDVASSGSGSGLGLAHACSALEAWGGQLLIESALGRGTRVILNLPSAERPNWFAAGLCVSRDEKQKIVVLDDDQSIHGIWDGRLHSVLGAGLATKKVMHVSTPIGLRDLVRSTDSSSSTLYLCDYELLGFKETGLDLIEELGIAQYSVLVTSRFEEEHIRTRCEKLFVKMIPKSMAAHVPLIVEQAPLAKSQGSRSKQCTLDAVLIDDDSLVHMVWKLAAGEQGKTLLLCANEAEFMARANEISFDTPIYIDQNLESGVKGVEVAGRLSERGYSNLYLSTGEEPSVIGEYAFLKNVVGKSPPWSGI